MGPRGFWPELKERGACQSLKGEALESLLEGRSVAIDAAIWLYEAQSQSELVQLFGANGASVKVFFERCVRFLRKGVLPVVVLEGQGGGRSERNRGGAQLGRAFAPHDRIRSLLDSMGIPFVDAEGEAEATCAALNASGVCDFAASGDFDVLLFGASRVLRELHLADRSIDSECDLWEAAHIDSVAGLNRDALIAAVFLAGSDYDLRKPEAGERRLMSQRSLGSGVRGVGVKQAMRTALELRRSSNGETLSALAAMAEGDVVDASQASQLAIQSSRCRGCKCCGHGNVAKKAHGKRGCAECGTSEGCVPRLAQGGVCECDYCVQVRAAGGQQRVRAARTLVRTASNMSGDPDNSQGAQTVTSQYRRHVHVRYPSAGSLSWCKFDEDKLKDNLSGIYKVDDLDAKLLPLHLEICLRRMASECPQELLSSLKQRRAWALQQNLRYCPASAKRVKAGPDATIAPYVLVDWIVADDEAEASMDLPPSIRRARTSLARDCRLLEMDSLRPCMLQAMWKQLLEKCPEQVRWDEKSLSVWSRDHGLDLIPVDAIMLQSGKFKIRWKRLETGQIEAKASMVAASNEVDAFGLPKLAGKEKAPACKRVNSQKLPPNQLLISSFFRNSSNTSDNVAPQTPQRETSSVPRQDADLASATTSPMPRQHRLSAMTELTPLKRAAPDERDDMSRSRRRFRRGVLLGRTPIEDDAGKSTQQR